MKHNIKDEADLLHSIKQLPRELDPPDRVWSAIEQRIGAERPAGQRRTGRWRTQAIAASVMLAFVLGLMFGRQSGEPVAPPSAAPQRDMALMATLEATEREYQAAFREFIGIGSARTMLNVTAVGQIEESWLALQQAEYALMAALSEFPDNLYLNQKLMNLRAQQLGFMQQLAMLDQYSRRNT